MAKIALLVVLALVGFCSAASFGGLKDFAGNYYDFTTGQYSSALTGKVYNTAPVVAPVAPVAYAAAPYAAAPYAYAAPSYTAPVVAAAPYYAAPYAPYAYGGAAYVSPLWKK